MLAVDRIQHPHRRVAIKQVKRGWIVLYHLLADDDRTRQQWRQFTPEERLRCNISRSDDRTGSFFPFFTGRKRPPARHDFGSGDFADGHGTSARHIWPAASRWTPVSTAC